MASCTDNNIDLNAVYKLADELGQLVLREHQILLGEMRQLGTLVGDAVKNLDSNFRHLSISASEQADIMSKVFDDGCINEDQQHRFSLISNQINVHASKTIRVLQFDDIVQQLASHSCDRISRMQELFNELESTLSKIKALDSSELYEIEQHIKTMRDEVGHFRVKLEKENPVKQNSMKEGKIELF